MSGGPIVYGVTPAGFVLKPVAQILAEYTADLLALIDPTTDVSTDQPLGQALKIGSKKIGEVWQIGQVAYNATNRGDAEDDLLDNIGSLSGTIRAEPTPSAVQASPIFSAAGTYAKGALVCAPPAAATAQFANATDIVVPAIGADGVNPTSATNTWPSASGSGGVITFGGGGLCSMTPAPGTTVACIGQPVTISNPANHPSNSGTFIITGWSVTAGVNTITWTNISGGADTVSWIAGPFELFLFESLATGPDSGDALVASNAAATGVGIYAFGQSAHTLTQIAAPVAGWVSVADVGLVAIGTLEELDPPYRVRQVQDLSAPGSNTLDACRAAILRALQNAPFPPPNPSVQMYENTTLTTDGNGLPGKSFMAVVFDTATPGFWTLDNPLIGQAIWNNKPGGLQAYGTTSVTITDSQGTQRILGFTRPTATAATLGVTVYVGAAIFGNALLSAALATAVGVAMTNAAAGLPFTMYGNTITPGIGAPTTLVPGQDLISEVFRSIAQGQPGVIDAQPTTGTTLITSGGTNAKGNLTIDISHYATITVAVTVALFVP